MARSDVSLPTSPHPRSPPRTRKHQCREQASSSGLPESVSRYYPEGGIRAVLPAQSVSQLSSGEAQLLWQPITGPGDREHHPKISRTHYWAALVGYHSSRNTQPTRPISVSVNGDFRASQNADRGHTRAIFKHDICPRLHPKMPKKSHKSARRSNTTETRGC